MLFNIISSKSEVGLDLDIDFQYNSKTAMPVSAVVSASGATPGSVLIVKVSVLIGKVWVGVDVTG